jgi:cytochrome c-type biogenesis protein CcmH/NrfF
MGDTLFGILTIVGPIVLLVAFIWVVMRSKRRAGEASPEVTEQATKANYRAEERRHDDGTEGDT